MKNVLKETERYSVVVNKKEYKNNTESIRIVESANPFKLVVARAISDYLSASSRPWDTVHKADVNSQLLAQHLNTKFPEYKGGWEFRTLSSQQPFDIVCLNAGLIIEVKSVGKGGRLMGNASIYPDTVRAKYALPYNFKYPMQKALFQPVEVDLKETELDVLVVCVNYRKDIVSEFAIVDGAYWGVNEELYVDCRNYFADLNAIKDDINTTLAPENTFAEAMLHGTLGSAVHLDLRKLITLTNPVGRLNVSGKWSIDRQ